MGTELRGQFFLGHEAGHAFLDLTAFDEQQSGDAHHTVFHYEVGILVRIDLDDLHFAVPFTSQLLDDRVEHLAGLAPDRAKINQHGFAGIQHFSFERSFIYMD